MSHRLIVAIVLAALLSLVGVNAVLACDDYSPGYWKNHIDAWQQTGISPDDSFNLTLGGTFDPDMTLMDALWLHGGHVNKDARCAVAGLLNAALP